MIESKLKTFIEKLSTNPGVYQMRNKYQKILYIGKAKNLKNRVGQYFNKTLVGKTKHMMSKVHDIEVIITQTETEALLLENELIKTYKPKYNILLKDSKSYPYIFLSNHKYPRISLYRGLKKNNGNYFGPYPNVQVVKESISLLQKIFHIRTCTDNVCTNRTRPCLEYQINRCSAPCVNKITNADYNQDIKMVTIFLSGKDKKVLEQISKKMQDASNNQNYEKAAYYRDQLIHMRQIQEKHLNIVKGDIDVIYLLNEKNVVCVQVLFIRGGRQIAQESFYPKNIKEESNQAILAAFIAQYYLTRKSPDEIIINYKLADKGLLIKAFKTKIITRAQKEKRHYLEIAKIVAKDNISSKFLKQSKNIEKLKSIKEVLNLKDKPKVIECFDVSHTFGEATVASCVVFKNGAKDSNKYRKFNIKNIKLADDYEAIKQAVTRRYKRLKAEKNKIPNLILIDGGLGQLKKTNEALEDLNLAIKTIGVAKGKARKAGLETLIILDDNNKKQKINLPPNHLALLLINQIRDEAHRFAIQSHRKKRTKTRQTSILENIPGIGRKKRSALFNYFGGLEEVKSASIDEICKVKNISKTLAERIYYQLSAK